MVMLPFYTIDHIEHKRNEEEVKSMERSHTHSHKLKKVIRKKMQYSNIMYSYSPCPSINLQDFFAVHSVCHARVGQNRESKKKKNKIEQALQN